MIDTTEARIRRVIADELGVEEYRLADDATLQEELGADSLDIVELVMGLEEQFGIEVRDEEAEQLVRVIDVFKLLESKGVK